MKITTTLRTSYPPKTEDIGLTCVYEIRAQMVAENINATGETLASLQVLEDNYDRLTIAAVGHHAPIPSLEHGELPYRGDMTALVAELEKWVQVKPGFVLRGTPEQAAQNIARKIALVGTDRYIQPRNDIYTPALEKAVVDFRKRVKNILIETLLK